MTSVAEKKRRKKAAQTARRREISLAGGNTAPAPKGQGHRADLEPKDPPAELAVVRRLRDAGLPDTAANRRAVMDPLHGTDMGLCVWALSEGADDLQTLRDAWGKLSAARANFKARIIGQTGNPQGASLPMLPDPLQVDPSCYVDLRTPEAKDDAAAKSWTTWKSAIACLPAPQLQWAIRGALDGWLDGGTAWANGAPTSRGKNAVTALRILARAMG